MCFWLFVVCLIQSNRTNSEIGYDAYEFAASRRKVCGQHGLYIVLQLSGVGRSYEDVLRAVGTDTATSTSLHTLSKAANSLGFACQASTASPEYLRTCKLPLLIYARPGRQVSGEDAGHDHFTVAVARPGNGKLSLIEPTTGLEYDVSMDWFLGGGGKIYFLDFEANSRAWDLPGNILRITFLAPLSIALIVLLWTSIRKVSCKHIALCFIIVATSSSVSLADEGIWRGEHYDGVNSLYFMLSLNGFPRNLQDIRKHLGSSNNSVELIDIRNAASELGCQSTILKTNELGLRRLGMPVIVVCNTSRSRGFYFAVLTAIDENSVELIDGGYARWSQAPLTEFRRNWSGYVLAVGDHSTRKPFLLIPGVMLMTLISILLVRSMLVRRKVFNRSRELRHV